MFLAEYNRLRNYTKFVIEEGNLESIEDGLLDELYDTSNEYLKELTVYVLGLLQPDQLDQINGWWKNRGEELPELYLGEEDE
jgi:hypothetical protein